MRAKPVYTERHVTIRYGEDENKQGGKSELRTSRPWVICVGRERLRVSGEELSSLLATIGPLVKRVAELQMESRRLQPQIGGEEQD